MCDYAVADIKKYRLTEHGTDLLIHIEGTDLTQKIQDKYIKSVEVRIDDGRRISAEQRKKAYATIGDIAYYCGNVPEYEKEIAKYRYCVESGEDNFSLSNCSMDTARRFINHLMEFAIEHGIPLSDTGINRTDDVGKFLYYCIKHKKCCICGKSGEIHHVDAIGMGNDRRKVDDSNHRKMCLCRYHHTIAHSRGMDVFKKMYHVYGIIVKDSQPQGSL